MPWHGDDDRLPADASGRPIDPPPNALPALPTAPNDHLPAAPPANDLPTAPNDHLPLDRPALPALPVDFDATPAITTHLYDMDLYQSTFNTETFCLTLRLAGDNRPNTINVDIRGLLHHTNCVASVDRVGTTKLAVRAGKFTGVQRLDKTQDGYGIQGELSTLGTFTTLTQAALARVEHVATNKGAKRTANPSAERRRTRTARRVVVSDGEEKDNETERVLVTKTRAPRRIVAADDNSDDDSPPPPPNDDGEVEIVSVKSLAQRDAEGFADAVDLDA